jgi:hypothetical protein
VEKVLNILGGAALLLTLSLPVVAQHGHGGTRAGTAARTAPPQPMPARNAGMPNQGLQRDARMTPEERQQLRRDVHDHGRDIYRDRRGAPERR